MSSAIFKSSPWVIFAALLTFGAHVHAADFTQGVAVSGPTATIWFKSNVNTTWVDVHYQVNGGPQQNLRMTYNATTARDEQPVGVSSGNVLSYWFTYNNGTPAYDSATFTYTVGSAPPPPPHRHRHRHRHQAVPRASTRTRTTAATRSAPAPTAAGSAPHGTTASRR